ncbi:VC0807 family protein [Paenibacillus filicis]|uniref:VC0807 family protein n=1 Tax=Paenibacillus filicis TaxID=669464 RepID=A0ABU9DTM2_9BACL
MKMRNYVLFALLINGLAPWGIYVWLSLYTSSLTALMVATLVPLVDNLVHVLKHRKLDAFGGIMLFSFLLTLGLAAGGGSEELLLIRESFVTGSIGLIFLISLANQRPIMFYLALRFLGRTDFSDNWRYPYFRYVMRLMTLVWGVVLVAESAVRIVMVYRLTTAQFLALSNVVLYGFVGAAILWTVLYRRKSAGRLERMKLQDNDQVLGG